MTRPPPSLEWRYLYAAIVVLVVAMFLYTLLPVLSPVILLLALLLLLAPFSGTRLHLQVILAASLLVAIWVLRTLGALIAPFILALVLAYILDPLVDRLEGLRIRRGIAVALIMLPLLVIIILLAAFGIPALIQQASDVIQKLPTAIQRVIEWVEATRARLVHLPFFRDGSLATALESISPESIAVYLQERQDEVLRGIWSGVLGVRRGFSIALGILGYFVLVPVIMVYLLLDFDSITRRAGALIPEPRRGSWIPLIREYDSLLSKYLRGQVLAATAVGILTWLGLWALGFPYSGLVGAVAGVFNLVPYLGLVVSAIPALIISILSGNVLLSLIKAGAVFVVVQALDGTVIGPRIVGGSVGLHPVWVILALTIGGSLFGFVGLLLAMPAAVLIKLLLREAMARYRNSRLFREGA